jgi:hypothetical protein
MKSDSAYGPDTKRARKALGAATSHYQGAANAHAIDAEVPDRKTLQLLRHLL